MPPPARLIAAIDQGSTLTKGVLYDEAENPVARAEAAVEARLDGVRVEHEPAALVDGVRGVLGELARSGPIAALGLACQRSTCLVWERRSGRALTPALSWQDRRQAAELAELADRADEVARRTGLRLSPHYAASKLAWLLAQLPDGQARAQAGDYVAGTLDAFLVRQLVGADATEPGQAGRTLLYNLEQDAWDPWLCQLFGVPRAALPELRPSAGERGRIDGVPLTALLGDQQASLLGHGGWQAGTTAVHFGTGAFVLAATGDRLVRHPGLLSAVLAAAPEGRRLQLEGSINSAGSAVDWAARLSGERLEDWARTPLDPEGLPWVLPAFAGAAAPWWRPEAQAVVAGLGLATTGRDLLAATLVGLAMRVLDCLEALAEAGIETRRVRLSGKLARLEGLVGLIADAGGVTAEVAAEEETGLLGAARLAAAAAQGDPSILERPTAPRLRRAPSWTAGRRRRLRQRWRDFVRRALDLRGGS